MLSTPVEQLSRQEIRQLQLERLQMTLNRAYFNVDFYRNRMDSLSLLPEEMSTFEELQRFPFTTRQDLAAHYPYGLFAVPLRNIVRLKVTSPVLRDRGKPIVVGFTRHDVDMWLSLMVRLYEQLGVTDRDIVQVAFNFALFPGALTFNQAAESLGATLAPSATVSATLQLQIMQDFRSTVLATTAAFALHLAETMKKQQLHLSNLHLKLLLIGPDPLEETTRNHLEVTFGVPVYGLYGVAEMVEPGIAGECPGKNGLHWSEDQFLAEIVNPASGEHVPHGQEGELVITTLTAEGYPIIRYRTGDVTALHEGPCSCGRSFARITPISRRTDNRLSIRGIPLYPEEVEELLTTIDSSIADLRLLVHTRHGVGEQLEVLLVRPPHMEFPRANRSQYLEYLRSHVRRALGLGVRIQLVDENRLPKEGLLYKTIFKNVETFYESGT